MFVFCSKLKASGDLPLNTGLFMTTLSLKRTKHAHTIQERGTQDKGSDLSNILGLAPVRKSKRRLYYAGLKPSCDQTTRQHLAYNLDVEQQKSLFSNQDEVKFEKARRLITLNQNDELAFDLSINAYLDTRQMPWTQNSTITVITNAADILRKELSAPNYKPCLAALGTNCDPYQKLEKTCRLTREVLEVLQRTNHPVGIITSSALILRDIDLLKPMAEKGLVKVAITLPTLNPELAKQLEPQGSTPQERLKTMQQLSDLGIPVSVFINPVIPGLNDDEIEAILMKARKCGAQEAGYGLLHLLSEQKTLMKQWLRLIDPVKAGHIMALNQPRRRSSSAKELLHSRAAIGPYAWLVGRCFEQVCKKLRFNTIKARLRMDLFKVPTFETGQLALFE